MPDVAFSTRDVVLAHGTVRVAQARGGAAGGDPVPTVLVHGLSSSHACWTRVLPHWSARGGRVLAPDLPGFGGSDPVGEGYDVELVADTLAAALDEVGAERFDLVGHSLGGLLSTVLADRHPERVRRLALVASAGVDPMWPSHPAQVAAMGGVADRLMRARRRYGPGLAARPRARVLMFASVVADPEALSPADARLLIACSQGARRTSEALAAVLATDLRPRLERLPMPVGAAWGTEDRLIAATALDELHRVRPGSQVRLVPETAHLPMVERPAAFAAALDDLLTTLGQS